MGRTRYLVSYDIRDPKRLRKVASILEGFGTRVQYSLFECPLDEMLLAKAKAELVPIISHTNDQVLFISLGGEKRDVDLIIEPIGMPYTKRQMVNIV